MSLQEHRKNYFKHQLDDDTIEPDPFKLLNTILETAFKSSKQEPNAMALSTVSAQGMPSTRTILLRSIDSRGLVFFTNYHSKKARHLQQQPLASLLGYWPESECQVSIEGSVEKISTKESDEYFATRPRGSQIAAWASQQSQPLVNRQSLELAVAAFNEKHPHAVPRPEYWGGYRLQPILIEFWQGRNNRLHDRFEYTRATLEDTQWQVQRLAP